MMSEEGGDDSPPRPKRKIKRVVLLTSSSESDSDECVGVAGTRRKRLRVISDEEASDSSGSSIITPGTLRRKTLPKLRDSETESDSSGWASDPSGPAKATTSGVKPASGFASDSSEGNSDKCSICLLRFKDQQVGTPETCEHIFCLDCITEWSKNVNTCPVDRMTFNTIIVKACAGGRVLRTEQVKVIERRPSIEALVTEDLTMCEICGSTENEETMLLCDGCDLGYHMQCLTPPLTEVPEDQWLCPSCVTSLNPDGLMNVIDMAEVEDLLNDLDYGNLPLGPRPSIWRQPRNTRRSSRNVSTDQPSTSSGQRGNSASLEEQPATSRSTRNTRRTTVSSTTRRRATTKRRKYKRRRTKTVIIEYEVQENGKFPITRSVKRKVKRRRVKRRQPRTAARRSHVRASVRAKLQSLTANAKADVSDTANASVGVQQLSVRRRRAGIPSLRLFGNPNELDYFSDEDNAISEEASTAVATRPTSNIFSVYRQARRKMVSIHSPPQATSAPDLLSNILESQTLLHSKKSVISISVDGNVDYKLQTTNPENRPKKDATSDDRPKKDPLDGKKEERVDPSKARESGRSVPSYPGQSRGGGGWGGGYRGNYSREGAGWAGGQHHGHAPPHAPPSRAPYSYAGAGMRRDDGDFYDAYPRRPPQYAGGDDNYYDRARRPPDHRNNYPGAHGHPGHPGHTAHPGQPGHTGHPAQGRYSAGQSWPSYGGGAPGPLPRNDVLPAQSRHSFGGFENPVDMRMGQVPPNNTSAETFPRMDTSRPEKPHQTFHSHPLPEQQQTYRPMTQPPVFNFQKNELEKSEDEKSDPGLIIDTEKYDPTEPTNDEESGEEPVPLAQPSPPPPLPAATPPSPPPPPAVQSILAGLDTSTMNVPPNILDTAVRQVLKEHRNLISSPTVESRNERSDEDSDGDCPNFSIYSATSVHIANNTSSLTDDIPQVQHEDNMEDLVQEDDETPPSMSPVVPEPVNVESKPETNKTSTKPSYNSYESEERKKTEEEYKEKVSKRCPITTNTRNPIKIKLNTPSLIKRQVSLYDEEENSQEPEPTDKIDGGPEVVEEKTNCKDMSPKNDLPKTPERGEAKSDVIEAKTSHKIEKDENLSVKEEKVSDRNADKFSSETFKSVDVTKEEIKVDKQDKEQSKATKESTPNKAADDDASDHNEELEEEGDIDIPEPDEAIDTPSPKKESESSNRNDNNVEKMTESISETEDERSYTPCLDENKSNKDVSFEIDKDKGLEGLDTEMISEEEGNEMFSENERPPSEASRVSPPRVPPVGSEEGEISDKKKERKKSSGRDDSKKKKKKESKKEGKDKSRSKKKNEISFKKLSKSGKERNYRERDKEEKKSERERRDSADNESRNRRRKEKRKDLERYDVRTVVTEKRRKQKDPFGRDVSPRGRSPSLSPPPRSPSLRRSPSRLRRTPSRRSLSRARRSLSRTHRSISRPRRSPSRTRRTISRSRRSLSRLRRSPSRGSLSARRRSPVRKSISRRASVTRGRTPRVSPRRRSAPRRKRRRSASRVARRRSVSASPPRRAPKKKKRSRRAPESVERKRRRSVSRQPSPSPPSRAPSPRPPSPRTPPPEPEPDPALVHLLQEEERRERRRRDPERRRRARDVQAPSKEVFTSGDNILVSVSFKEQERDEDGERRRRRESRRERRRRRRTVVPDTELPKPVAIIDLDRSPFRELTPSPKNVIVLSDSDHGERGESTDAPPAPAAPEPAPEPAPVLGPKTPPSPAAAEPAPPAPAPAPAATPHAAPPSPPSAGQSPDAYDPFEPTRSPSASASATPRSASASPGAEAAEAGGAGVAVAAGEEAVITLEAAQRSNLSADEVLDRRPLTPVEKVLALLQSTRDAANEEAAAVEEAPPAPRILLPSPTRVPPKLFPGKPSPIKSNPVKPMQALRLPRVPPAPAPVPTGPPSDGGASPYSPGSSDFGELFEPPPRRPRAPPKVPVRLDRKKANKTQVGVKIDDDSLKILDDLPSSAVELQVKSKFLKKLNRQERVVEEVKLVLKPHYNKKRVTKEEYKDILRRAVPKICHNKSGEINPTKIQALVEAYVKKFRKKHKLGIA